MDSGTPQASGLRAVNIGDESDSSTAVSKHLLCRARSTSVRYLSHFCVKQARHRGSLLTTITGWVVEGGRKLSCSREALTVSGLSFRGSIL